MYTALGNRLSGRTNSGPERSLLVAKDAGCQPVGDARGRPCSSRFFSDSSPSGAQTSNSSIGCLEFGLKFLFRKSLDLSVAQQSIHAPDVEAVGFWRRRLGAAACQNKISRLQP